MASIPLAAQATHDLVRDESAIRRHLIPRLGDIQLAKLRQTDIQAFVTDLKPAWSWPERTMLATDRRRDASAAGAAANPQTVRTTVRPGHPNRAPR